MSPLLLLCFRPSPLQPLGTHLLQHLICTSWGPLFNPVVMVAVESAKARRGDSASRGVWKSRSTSSLLRPGGSHPAELTSWERVVAAARSRRGHEGSGSLHGPGRDGKAWGNGGWAAPGLYPQRGSACDDCSSLPSLAAQPWSSSLPFMVSDSGPPQLVGEPVPTTSGGRRTLEQARAQQGLEKQPAWTRGGGQAGVRIALASMRMGSADSADPTAASGPAL